MFTAVVTVYMLGEHGNSTFLFDDVVHDEDEYADLLNDIDQRIDYRLVGHEGKIRVISEISRRTSTIMEC